MNSIEMNDRCKQLGLRLSNLYSDTSFIVGWDNSPYGHSVEIRCFEQTSNGFIGKLLERKVIVDGAKTKQAAYDLASMWIDGLSASRHGNFNF